MTGLAQSMSKPVPMPWSLLHCLLWHISTCPFTDNSNPGITHQLGKQKESENEKYPYQTSSPLVGVWGWRKSCRSLKERRKMEKNVEHFGQITSAGTNLTPIDSSIFLTTEADKKQLLLSNYFCSQSPVTTVFIKGSVSHASTHSDVFLTYHCCFSKLTEKAALDYLTLKWI